jgi:hypothetical protein
MKAALIFGMILIGLGFYRLHTTRPRYDSWFRRPSNRT